MAEVSLKEYVDARFHELDKRVMALNEAKHQNMAMVAMIVALLALFVSVTDVALWAFRK